MTDQRDGHPDAQDTDDPGALADLAAGLARRAGAVVLDVRQRAITRADTKSTPTDPVTEGDRAAEAVVVDGIRAARPDDTIVGEEGTDHQGTSAFRWFVDPIDGTVNYLYGIPAYSISIGVGTATPVPGGGTDGTDDRQAGLTMVAGVVYNPVTDELFRAEAGRGATLNGTAIEASATTEFSQALVGTGFGYGAERRRAQAATMAALLPEIRDLRRFGSAALDLCSVACGRLDGYYEAGLNSWDYAAGWLVATEAGAVVDDLQGGPPSSGFLVAAAPGVHRALSDRLFELDAHRATAFG